MPENNNIELKQFSIKSTDIPMPVIQETSQEIEVPEYKMLTPVQQRFVHVYLGGDWKNYSEIARLLNVKYQTVHNWMVDKRIKRVINEYQEQEHEIITQGLKALRLKALFKMGELIDSRVDGIAYQAARDILDRTGNKATVKQEVNINVQTFEQQVITMMKDINPKEFKIPEGEIIDA